LDLEINIRNFINFRDTRLNFDNAGQTRAPIHFRANCKLVLERQPTAN